MTTNNNYEWVSVKEGEKLTCPEIRMTLYVMQVKKKWVGIIQADYDKDYVYHTKKFVDINEAQLAVVNMLVGGLASTQLKLLESLVENA